MFEVIINNSLPRLQFVARSRDASQHGQVGQCGRTV